VTQTPKWRLIGATTLVALGGGGLGYWLAPRGRVSALDREPPARLAPSPSPASPPLPATIGYLGVILARRSIDISVPGAGRLESVDVQVGDVLAAGAVVGRLESRSLMKELAMAEAALGRIRSERAKAALELQQERDRSVRLERLSQEAAIVSQQDLSSARYQEKLAAARLEGVDANVKEQEARVAQMRDTLAEAQMRTPFAGVVANRYLDAGATVARGDRVVRVMGADNLLVRFAVPEGDARLLAVGRPVLVRIDDLGLAVAGEISGIAPDVDPPSQTIFVEAVLASPDRFKDSIVVGRAVRVSLGPAPERRSS
jgi:RND family efflux transporter MFP subunit